MMEMRQNQQDRKGKHQKCGCDLKSHFYILNMLTAARYRLPTEAEWDYAAEVAIRRVYMRRGLQHGDSYLLT